MTLKMATCNANSCLMGTTLLRHSSPSHVVRSEQILHGLCTSKCFLCSNENYVSSKNLDLYKWLFFNAV